MDFPPSDSFLGLHARDGVERTQVAAPAIEAFNLTVLGVPRIVPLSVFACPNLLLALYMQLVTSIEKGRRRLRNVGHHLSRPEEVGSSSYCKLSAAQVPMVAGVNAALDVCQDKFSVPKEELKLVPFHGKRDGETAVSAVAN